MLKKMRKETVFHNFELEWAFVGIMNHDFFTVCHMHLSFVACIGFVVKFVVGNM